MASNFPVTPLNMRRIFRRLKRWRSTHTGRRPIPECLWAAAADLARERGVYPTAKALHLRNGRTEVEWVRCVRALASYRPGQSRVNAVATAWPIRSPCEPWIMALTGRALSTQAYFGAQYWPSHS